MEDTTRDVPPGPPKKVAVSDGPSYYLKVPLSFLPPSADHASAAFDVATRLVLKWAQDIVPSWIASAEDVKDFTSIVKEGGTKDVAVGVLRVAERAIGKPERRESSESFESIRERLAEGENE